MRAGLSSRAASLGFLTACVALAAVYVAVASGAFLADRSAQTLDRAHLERAMRLEPGNAEYPYRLGVVAFRGQQDNALAEQSFRRAAALNPYRTRYWLSLAAVYLAEGDLDKQKSALEAAVAAEPHNPETTWEAGNLYLVEGDTLRALQMFRTTLESGQYSGMNVLDTCWRATGDVDLILRHAIPDDNRVRLELVRYLAQKNQPAAAAQAWSAVVKAREPLAAREALPYVDSLLARGDMRAAYAAWKDVLALDDQMKAYTSGPNLVVNNRFEEPLLNAGFDWRLANNAAVALSLDSLEFRERGRSLKLAFSGDPFRDAGLSQVIPVEPNRAYRFSAYVKAEELSSAEGPRFAVDDAGSGRPLLQSSEVLGTTPWKILEGEFQTGPETTAVKLHIVQESPAHIKGTMWVDGIEIAPQ